MAVMTGRSSRPRAYDAIDLSSRAFWATTAAERERSFAVLRAERTWDRAAAQVDAGLRAAIAIRRDHPGLGVLVFSQYIETRYAAELLAGGAAGPGRVRPR